MEEDYERGDYEEDDKKSDTPLTDSIRRNQNQKGFSESPKSRYSSMVEINPELAEIDRELEELVKRQQSKVKVFGVGGGGGNTISRIAKFNVHGVDLVAVNTDAQALHF